MARIRAACTALACIAGFVCNEVSPGAARLGTQPRERVVYAGAIDRATGTAVTTLSADALTIREDGVEREILRVTPATSPLPVAIIVDNSQAASPAIADLRRALTAFLNGIQGVGPIAIITVADRPTIMADYTTEPKIALDAANRLFAQPASGATLLDAISDTAKGLARRESDRAAIVVVTTENVEFSQLHYRDVLEALEASGASLHAAVLTNPKSSLNNDPARNRAHVLDRGPVDSGGWRRDVLTSMAFEPRLIELAGLLKHQFRVTYARPQSLIPPKKTEVSASKPGLDAYGAPARGQATK